MVQNLGYTALLLGILVFVIVNRRMSPLMVAGFALFLAGGFGNWVDRVANGNQVIDFMNVGIGSLRSGVFNVADLSVELGVILVIVSSFRTSK